MDETGKKDIPPKRRRRFKKRWVAYAFGIASLLALSADLYFEIRGLPDSLKSAIGRSFEGKGVKFHAGRIRCGLFRGAVIEDAAMELGLPWEAPSLKAGRMHATMSPLELLKGNFLPLGFEVSDGRLEVPVFPESGEEGWGDRIIVSDFNARLHGGGGRLFVSSATGKVQNMQFKVSGYFGNLLRAAGVKGGEALRDSMSEESGASLSKEGQGGLFAAAGRGFMARVPVQFRKRIMMALAKLKSEEFSETPVLEMEFAFDMGDYRKSSMKGRLSLPPFEYGKLKVDSIGQGFLMNDGALLFEGLHAELGDGDFIDASGVYDTVGNTLSGTISGLCSPDKMLLFMDETGRRSLCEKVKLGSGAIKFRGQLQNFAFSSSSYMGGVELKIPTAEVGGVKFKDISGFVIVEEGSVKGMLHQAKAGDDGEIEGDFLMEGERFEARVEGYARVETVKAFLPPETVLFVDDNVEMLDGSTPISFSGAIQSGNWRSGLFEGSLDLLLPRMKFKGVETRSLSARIGFGDGLFKADCIDATLDDGTKITGELSCTPRKGSFSASLLCKGSPERTLLLLGPEQRLFIESVIDDIEWPLAGNLVEASVDMHSQGSESQGCLVTGSLVMTEFSYKGVKFKYGATRFLLDSDKLLVLPGAILETADGQALMSIAYKGGDSSKESPGGRLDFSLGSQMSGNDLLRCLYPNWKSEYIDFPSRVKVSGSGQIDYGNPEASRFKAKIDNGSCLWKGVRVEDLDAPIVYGKRRLSIRGASAAICGGRLDLDYNFDFKGMDGDLGAKAQNVELQSMLNSLGWGGMVGQGEAGGLSGCMQSKLSYDKDGLLHMDGKGVCEISGADLWSIPLFGDFLSFLGKAWSLKSLGKITSIQCEFKLAGDRLTTESVKSDGGVVALSARGDYLWNSNEFDFKFRAELLKGALPFETMSTLLTPVSWMLERRLHGKDRTFTWE